LKVSRFRFAAEILTSINHMISPQHPVTVAWISYFPVEWLSDVPEEVRRLPPMHPATWQQVLLAEMEKDPRVKLHIIVLRKQFAADLHFERNGVSFHLLKTRNGLRAPSLYWHDTWLIRRQLKQIKPDLVHAWGTEHGAGLVATRLGYPHLVSIQGLFTFFKEHVRLDWHGKLAQLLEVPTVRRAQALSAESVSTVEFLRRMNPRRQPFHIEHPPLTDFYKVIRQPEGAKPVLLVVGSWDFRKGSDLLLQAMAQLRRQFEFTLVCVTHPQAAFHREITRGVALEFIRQIEFKSNLTTEQMMAEFGRATLLLMASRADTGPVAVKEAVVAGLPVVATEVGGVPEYIVPFKNGLFCRPGRAEEFQRAVAAALGHPMLSKGQVDGEVLREKREYLSGKRAANLFIETYQQLTAPALQTR
jgi:glycosyltransferase involved in cell wall biosynthesis